MGTLQEGIEKFWGLYHAGLWEPHTKAFIQDNLGPGDLYVDIGAWIGPTVLWALETGATVIAIEPDPVSLPELYKIRDLGHEIEIWPGAVATETGQSHLVVCPNEGGEYGDSMSRLGSDGISIKAWTLPEILSGRRPKMVKMDVEGYETDLCPSLVPWLAEIGCPFLQISCHGVILDKKYFEGYSHVIYPDHLWGDIQTFSLR